MSIYAKPDVTETLNAEGKSEDEAEKQATEIVTRFAAAGMLMIRYSFFDEKAAVLFEGWRELHEALPDPILDDDPDCESFLMVKDG